MRRFDLHVHSRHSPDAKGSILELAMAAQEKGLHGLAITDHDRCPDPAELDAAAQQTGMVLVSGCESSTIEGHVLCYGITEAPAKGLDLQDLVAHVHAQGGLCVPAHPLKMLSGIGPSRFQVHWAAGRFAAAEGINGRDRRIVQDNTLHWLRAMDIPTTGGTDAHWVRDVGTAWTWMPDHVDSAKHFLKALRAGDVQGDGANLRRRSVWTHGASVPFRRMKARVRRSKEDSA